MKNKNKVFLVLIIAVLSLSSGLRSYPLNLFGLISIFDGIWEEFNIEKRLEKEKKIVTIEKFADPSLSSPASSPITQFNLEGIKDKKIVATHIGIKRNNLMIDLKLKGPIGEGETKATLANLDGLVNSVTADIGLTWLKWKPKYDENKAENIFCDYIQHLKQEKDLTDEEINKLNIRSWQDLPKDYQARFKEAIDWGIPILFGFRLKAGREKFEYFNSTSFEIEDQSKTNYVSTIILGTFFPKNDIFLGANYRYEISHKIGKSQNLCIPFNKIEGALNCNNLPIGGPEKQKSSIGQIEIRKFCNGRFAINPKISYNFTKDILGFEFPIFFLKNKDKGLSGGISIGWRSDTKETTINFFVGEALGILGK